MHAYTPLILWTGLGLLLFRFMPDRFPRLLGRSLYWVGVPLEILALARRTDFSQGTSVTPIITIVVLLLGLGLSWLSWQAFERPFDPNREDVLTMEPSETPSSETATRNAIGSRSRQGSYILSSTISNTGFVGLAIAPFLVSDRYLGLIIIYGVTHNILGTYGLGVFISSYFGQSEPGENIGRQIRDVLSVPSLWVFAFGVLTQSVVLPSALESGLQNSLLVVIPAAFLLTGMRLRQLQGWKSLKVALVPAGLKVAILPLLLGGGLTLLGWSGDARLALVLMSGMPTAFGGLILAEEYDLDRELITSSLILTTIGLLVMIPVWLVIFG
ncbi:MAG: AEC family transporter [Cyanobacteriota bacterium]|nr:AEC family transporter [Cyanobacteriota bacterium]